MAFGRRKFLAGMTAGASALAMQSGLLNFAAALAGEPPQPTGKPKVRAVFVYPKDHEKYWMSWPGHTYDVPGSQALYIKTLSEAAGRFGVQLDVQTEPVEDAAGVTALLDRQKKDPCDGVIVTLMHMGWWEHVNRFLAGKGDLPALVFVPLGTTFTGHLQKARKEPKTFVGSTQDVSWLAQAVRMFRTMGSPDELYKQLENLVEFPQPGTVDERLTVIRWWQLIETDPIALIDRLVSAIS